MKEVYGRGGYRPRSCVWELSLLCDLRCKHCGSYAGERRPDELSYDELVRVTDQLIEIGVELVTVGGGEPTLHPHWATLSRRLVDGGVQVNMITNGWGFNERKLKQAQDAGLIQIAFSIDGLREAHDEVRRKGSFDRVVRGVDLCVAAGMSTGAVTHINRLNNKSLPEIRQLLQDHGVSVWQLQLGNPSGAMCEHSSLVIEPADLLWLLPEIAELQARHPLPRIDAGDNIGYYGVCELGLRTRGRGDQAEYVDEIPFWIGCAAGMRVVGIESNGNVKGCLSLPSERNGQNVFIEGNLRQNTLQEIWNRPGAFAYNRDYSEEWLSNYCRSCDARDLCRGGCSWTAFSHTGNRGDNPYCFHRVAREHGRLDLLVDPDSFRQPLLEYLAQLDAAPEEEPAGET